MSDETAERPIGRWPAWVEEVLRFEPIAELETAYLNQLAQRAEEAPALGMVVMADEVSSLAHVALAATLALDRLNREYNGEDVPAEDWAEAHAGLRGSVVELEEIAKECSS